MRHKLISLISLGSILLGGALFAKGPMVQGTYQAEDPFDPALKLTIKFVTVNIPGTTTRVSECSFDWDCEHGETKTVPCANESLGSCKYLRDFVFTRTDYVPVEGDPDRWEIDFAKVQEEGRVVPFATLKTNSAGIPSVRLIMNSTGREVVFKKLD
jgi:hypothetical protein